MEKQETDPAVILTLLNERIRIALRQEETNNDDGMEIQLCRVKKQINETFEVVFSGTKTRLYYISENTLSSIYGDKVTIGGNFSNKNKDFTNKKVVLNKGDYIYLATDGIVDVCNRKRKKYGTKRLENKLVELYNHPLETQKDILVKDMEIFQEGVAQRDDITVLGIKL